MTKIKPLPQKPLLQVFAQSEATELEQLESTSPTRVMVTYADEPTRRIASRLCSAILKKLPQGIPLATSWWSFTSLQHFQILRAAVTEGVTADLIFCACNANEDLPSLVKAWIDLCLPSKLQDSALVALLRRSPKDVAQPNLPETYLRGVAQCTGVDFFSQEYEDSVLAETILKDSSVIQ